MSKEELLQIQTYLRKTFGCDRIAVKKGGGYDAPTEVLVGDEFIGTLYKNDDEGDLSYDFMMSILPEDLE